MGAALSGSSQENHNTQCVDLFRQILPRSGPLAGAEDAFLSEHSFFTELLLHSGTVLEVVCGKLWRSPPEEHVVMSENQ